MKVRFKNGTSFNCTSPIEQKIFKQNVASGWLLSFSLVCDITSEDADVLLTTDNISELTFTSEETGTNTEGETTIGTVKTILLSDYNKVSSSVIRYSEEKDKTRIEIQLIKGV